MEIRPICHVCRCLQIFRTVHALAGKQACRHDRAIDSPDLVIKKRALLKKTQHDASELLRAFDRSTGKQIWEAQWEGAMTVPFFAASNGSWIRATPAFDGKHLFVAGIRDVLVCLDASNGNIVWKLDFVAKTKSSLPSFGFVSSPLVDGQHVYVQAGGSLAKIDKREGKIVWQSLKDGGGMFGSE